MKLTEIEFGISMGQYIEAKDPMSLGQQSRATGESEGWLAV